MKKVKIILLSVFNLWLMLMNKIYNFSLQGYLNIFLNKINIIILIIKFFKDLKVLVEIMHS